MDREEFILGKYGICPGIAYRDEIRKLLKEEIENEQNVEDHECLRVLCFLLFSIGNVEDCELIWEAKMLNMDTGCMIDTVLLCGAGYEKTLAYIENRTGFDKMRMFLTEYLGGEFDKHEVIGDFKSYYGIE